LLIEMAYGTPNAFAWAMLLFWFPVAFVLFKKYEPSMAAVLTLVGGKMVLPEGISYTLPVFPDLNKRSIPIVCAFVGVWLTSRGRFRQAKPWSGVDKFFFVLLAGDVGTVFTNPDPLMAKEQLPGLGLYDLLSIAVEDVVIIYGTFLLGRTVLRSTRELRNLFQVCIVFALLYTPIFLFEFKMGPQTNNIIYGYLQHDPSQAARGGGFRPLGFTAHGLVLARFMTITLLGGATLMRLKIASGKMIAGLIWLLFLFINIKSMGAIVMLITCAPLIAFGSFSAQLRTAIILAAIVFMFPVLRGAGWFPTDQLVEWSASINPERGVSLGGRFDNEDMLLEKARQRIWFGWGEYGRHHVYDPDTGEDLAVTDGEWIIILGTRGVFGFLGIYGLYLSPIYIAWRHGRRLRTRPAQLLVGAFSLITVLMAIDTLPNASLGWPHMFWSGGLAGVTEGMLRQDRLSRLRALWKQRTNARAAAHAIGDAAQTA
jgi:hypothetical protein